MTELTADTSYDLKVIVESCCSLAMASLEEEEEDEEES
jgi:hypothetical protein